MLKNKARCLIGEHGFPFSPNQVLQVSELRRAPCYKKGCNGDVSSSAALHNCSYGVPNVDPAACPISSSN